VPSRGVTAPCALADGVPATTSGDGTREIPPPRGSQSASAWGRPPIGQRSGRWLVVAPMPNRGRHRYVAAVCACGAARVVDLDSLRHGSSQSCGCVSREVLSQRTRTHGHTTYGTRSKEHGAWMSMIKRCEAPRNEPWRHYRGRGQVCPEWRAFLAAFLAAVGPCPGPGYSIDRIDVNGHYKPANVRWATVREQARNTRMNRRLTIAGSHSPSGPRRRASTL
jgi:hypothetical protein